MKVGGSNWHTNGQSADPGHSWLSIGHETRATFSAARLQRGETASSQLGHGACDDERQLSLACTPSCRFRSDQTLLSQHLSTSHKVAMLVDGFEQKSTSWMPQCALLTRQVSQILFATISKTRPEPADGQCKGPPAHSSIEGEQASRC